MKNRMKRVLSIGVLLAVMLLVGTAFSGSVYAKEKIIKGANSRSSSYTIGVYTYNKYYDSPGRGHIKPSQEDSNWQSYFYATGDYYGTIDIGVYRFSAVWGADGSTDLYTWGYRIYYSKTNNLNYGTTPYVNEPALLTGDIDNIYVGGIQYKQQGLVIRNLEYNTKYYFWVFPIVFFKWFGGIKDPNPLYDISGHHTTWLQQIDAMKHPYTFNHRSYYFSNPDFNFYYSYKYKGTYYGGSVHLFSDATGSDIQPILHGYVTTKGTPPSPPPGCVLKNTKILTPFGYKKVQNIKPGTIIDTYDLTTEHISFGIVLLNTKSSVDTIESINNILWVTTYDQPIYIRNKTYEGWLHNPVDLRVGWQMYDPVHNKWINITQIKIYSGHFEVYDMQIEPYENFIANGTLLKDKPIPR